jgi:hypothetical protein
MKLTRLIQSNLHVDKFVTKYTIIERCNRFLPTGIHTKRCQRFQKVEKRHGRNVSIAHARHSKIS